MIYVVARDHREGAYYCTHADPPLNPNNWKEVTILSTNYPVANLRGRHITDEDTIVWYGRYMNGKHLILVLEELRRAKHGSNPKEISA